MARAKHHLSPRRKHLRTAKGLQPQDTAQKWETQVQLWQAATKLAVRVTGKQRPPSLCSVPGEELQKADWSTEEGRKVI